MSPRPTTSIALALTLALGLRAAGAWETVFTGTAPPPDQAADLVQDAAGNLVSAGYTTDADLGRVFTVLKTTRDGRELWRHRLAGTFPASSEIGGASARALAIASNGDVVAVGDATNVDTSIDAVVVRLEADTGTERWRTVIAGAAAGYDFAGDVAVTPTGDIVVLGEIQDRRDDPDFAVFMLAGDSGVERWRRVLDGSQSDFDGDTATAIVTTPDGDVLAAGCLGNQTTGQDFTVMRLAGTTGATQWSNVLNAAPGSRDCAHALALTGDGDVIAAGALGSGNPTLQSFTVVTFTAATGTERWRTHTGGGGSGFEEAYDVTLAPGGDVYVAGALAHPDTLEDFAVARIRRSDGKLLWTRFLAHDADVDARDAARSVLATADGALIAVGSHLEQPVAAAWSASGDLLWTTPLAAAFRGGARAAVGELSGPFHFAADLGSAASNGDYGVVTLDSDAGTEIRRVVLGGTGTESFDFADAVAVDGSGDVVAAGGIHNAAGRQDLLVAKLAGRDGALRWRRELAGGDGTFAEAYDVAVDPAGDVVAAGETSSSSGSGRLSVLELSGADGTDRWRVDVAGSATSGWHRALAIDLDRAGNAAVAGVLTDEAGEDDSISRFTVLDLDGATGSERWRFHLGDPRTPSAGVARAVVHDGAGDVVAAGDLEDEVGRSRLAVVKLGGTDGTERWRFVLDPGLEEQPPSEAAALAVDARGDTIAVGTVDYERGVALKLAAANGGERWRFLLDPADGDRGAFLTGVAVLPRGDVVVAGRTFDGDGRATIVVVGLDGTSGVERWRHVGALLVQEGGGEVIAAVEDDVLLAWTPGGGSGPVKSVTTRLAGDTGTVRWERETIGLRGDGEFLQAIAVGPGGNPVVAGATTRPGSAVDVLVRLVSGVDGGDAFCGDGVVQAAERCDDGNVARGDCCDASCLPETDPVCADPDGPGGGGPGGGGDPGGGGNPDDPGGPGGPGHGPSDLCQGERVPPGIARLLAAAERLVGSTAGGQSGRSVRSLRRADRLLRKAGARTTRAGAPRRRHPPQISSACAAELQAVVAARRAAVQALATGTS